VIISSVQLVLMYCFIMSESVVFCVLFSMSYVYLLSPICLICKVTLIYVVMNVYELSLKSTNLLTISAIILTCNSLNNNENLVCYVWCLLFVDGQVNEFICLLITIWDTYNGCYLYSVDGCHLYHIVVGFVILLVYLWHVDLHTLELSYVMYGSWVRTTLLYHHGVLLYWHFVEILWIFIYYTWYI